MTGYALKTIGAMLFSAALQLCLFAADARALDADCANVPTDKGLLTGAQGDNGVCAFKGVPYAAPPVDELRFKKPQPHAPWSEPLKADRFGEQCLQFPMSLFPSDKIIGSEDCLYLNVYASTADAAPKPVMVFIHGGGFVYGSGAVDTYDGTRLAGRGGVVVVTINYRLGSFGFMAHPALRDETGVSGNWGIHDQLAALRWVKTNIAAFGGDPENVTVFGESAGGMSVGVMLMSPIAGGLFRNAVVESGPLLLLNLTMEKADEQGLRAAAKLGCADPATAADCLRKVDPQTFMGTIKPGFPLLQKPGGERYAAEPIIDGVLMTATPLQLLSSGNFNKANVIVGSNRDEMSFLTLSRKIDTEQQLVDNLKENAALLDEMMNLNLDGGLERLLPAYPVSDYPAVKDAFNDLVGDIIFTCPTRMLADRLSAAGNNVYLYQFSKAPDANGPFKTWGAFHGSELAFVFGNFEFMGIKFKSKENIEVSKKVMDYWSSFAKTGAPAAKDAPAWPAYNTASRPYVNLDLEIKAGEGLKADKCAIFEEILTDAAK